MGLFPHAKVHFYGGFYIFPLGRESASLRVEGLIVEGGFYYLDCFRYFINPPVFSIRL